MAALNVHIGPLVFDHAHYDADGDVLYLHVGEPVEGEGEETPEGHVVRFQEPDVRIVLRSAGRSLSASARFDVHSVSLRRAVPPVGRR